jgi:GrpB-like predicted nucleotidyltransferase (UPF0157 family)
VSVEALGLPSGVVRLAAPDGSWSAAFREEQARLRDALSGLPAVIEHVGSTAIPGLPAKPILDVMVGRPAASELAPYVRALVSVGYRYRGENGLPGREYFLRELLDGRRTHHLHLVVEGGTYWEAYLGFREYLRRVPARAAEYAALKQALAVRYAGDREAYTDAKTEFIVETLRLAAGSRGAS